MACLRDLCRRLWQRLVLASKRGDRAIVGAPVFANTQPESIKSAAGLLGTVDIVSPQRTPKTGPSSTVTSLNGPLYVNGYIAGVAHKIELFPLGEGFYLAKEAAQAFIAMRDAAKADGIKLRVNSAFRTNEKQTKLRAAYDKAMELYRLGKGPQPAPVNRPGWSNHQSGNAVDINRAPGDRPDTDVPDSPIDNWLAANGTKFGFRRDPREPWHWNYIGVLV